MQQFQKKIWEFYKKNKRDFPWRETTNPYHILVSEVMLQQTQTSRVISKYQEFLKKFPTPASLAQATNAQVLSVWSGLGYNRRALYLKKTAEILTSTYHTGSDIEATHRDNSNWLNPKLLKTFPGIGSNTAGAIYVFTTNKPYLFIETNIRRVYIYEFFKDQEKISDKDIIKILEQNLDTNNPREFYYALMDYGAFLGKTKTNPNKRSKNYIRQSKFEGSLRQIRGKILKILLEEKTINKQVLMQKIQSQHFEAAFGQLQNEHFLQIDHNNTVKIS